MSEVVPLRRIIILACCLALAPIAASAGGHRSREATREFQRLHPWPLDRPHVGRLPPLRQGFVPLDCGGADAVVYLQWQTTEAAKAKDRWKRKSCGR
jgi:hypothetical protein